MGDKIQRLQNISKKGIVMVNDESVRDTLLDLHNYCAMAMMLLDEDTQRLAQADADASRCLKLSEPLEYELPSRGSEGAEPIGVNDVSQCLINEPGIGYYTVDDLKNQ
jgi:hypothetical protein